MLTCSRLSSWPGDVGFWSGDEGEFSFWDADLGALVLRLGGIFTGYFEVPLNR